MSRQSTHDEPADQDDAPNRQSWVSGGVRIVAYADTAVAVDLAAGRLHVLSAAATWLLTAEGPEAIDELIASAREAHRFDPTEEDDTGATQDQIVEDQIRAGVDDLVTRGLIGRPDPYTAPEPPPRPGHPDSPGRHTGVTHAVLAHRVAFRSDAADLIAEIDTSLGDACGDPAEEFFDAVVTDDGGVDLYAPDTWAFPNRDALLTQLPTVLNDHAARSHDVLVLHAGGVRTPGGRIIMLTGHANSGKTTLVGALIAAGCDYLGDESVGLGLDLVPLGYPKPLTVDATTRSLLALSDDSHPHAAPEALRATVQRINITDRPVDEVIEVAYRPDGPHEARRLDPDEALETLCAHTLNLARAGDEGLAALCKLAETTPVWRLVHPGIEDAVPWTLDEPRIRRPRVLD